MKKPIKPKNAMKYYLYIILAALLTLGAASCKHLEEEPEVNLGYDQNYAVPDAEDLTPEDYAAIAAEKTEYNTNAK